MQSTKFTQYSMVSKGILIFTVSIPHIAYWGYLVVACINKASWLNESKKLVPFVAVGIMLIAMYVLAYVVVAPEILAALYIGEEGKIVWKMPLFKRVTMTVTPQVHITVNRGQGRQTAVSEIERLRYCRYICFSTTEIPVARKNKINSLRCKEGFIRFPYTDRLCLELIARLPADATVQLQAFYDGVKSEEARIRGK